MSYSFDDPDGYSISFGSVSFNPDYKIYESNDGGSIHPRCQFMEANRTYSFTIKAGDESGKIVTATATSKSNIVEDVILVLFVNHPRKMNPS